MAACFIKPSKEVEFKRYKRFLDFLKDSIFWKNLINPVVMVEDSSLQNITFNNSTNRAILSRLSRNVGMNQGASRIAYEWIKDNATFYLYNRDDWYGYAQIEGDYSIVKERIETKNKMILQSGILKSN